MLKEYDAKHTELSIEKDENKRLAKKSADILKELNETERRKIELAKVSAMTIDAWLAANNTCFTTFGGRLPTYSEWYIAMNNYALTNETDDYEHMIDGWSGANSIIAGSGAITTYTGGARTTSRAYRCWIPR